MRHHHLVVLAALVLALALQAPAAPGASAALVTSAADSGPGSFRAAVAAANADDGIGQIVFTGNVAPIGLQSTVLYTGSQSLTIVANAGVLDGSALTGDADVFRAETPGDLTIGGLTVRNAAGEGIEYQVPGDAAGVKRVSLNRVRVVGSAAASDGRGGHGVLVNDQAFPEESGDADASPPVPPNPAGSAASLEVTIQNSEFVGNGFAALDRDGLRVNEGGAGDLTIVARNSRAADNGADGIELDERGSGSVDFTISGTEITGNGSFHEVFPPVDPDDVDLDDGMDVDESADGDLVGRVTNSLANDNLEEGWDLNENDAGDFRVDMTNVQASGNREEGVDFEEDDDFAGGGDLVTTLVRVTTNENGADGGDAGLKIREKGVGNLDARVRDAEAWGNVADGINVREDASGSLAASLDRPVTLGNGGDGVEFEENADGDLVAVSERVSADGNAQDGVEFDENGAGDLSGTLRRGTALGNGSVGVRADQQPPGVGALALERLEFAGLFTANVTVTQAP